ncbi:MAG: L,D-transpeptidase family protein [Bacteroidota bacterium]
MKYFSWLLLTGLFFSCQHDKKKEVETEQKPTVVVRPKLPIELTDSVLIKQHLSQYKIDSASIAQVVQFYADTVGKHPANTLVWSDKGQLHGMASMFINLIDHAEDDGLPMKSYHTDDIEKLYLEATDSTNFENAAGRLLRQELDVLLTASFFKYADQLWKGRIDPNKKQWFVKRKSFDYSKILHSLLNGSVSFTTYEPLHREYGLLRKALQKYRQIEKDGGWPLLTAAAYKNLAIGDTSQAVFLLAKRLQITDDIPKSAIDSVFNTPLVEGLKKFQKRHGLPENAIMGPKTIQQLNIPVEKRINQILVNMERWRWVPAGREGTYIGINIPEFVLHVFENNKQVWQMDVIVGQAATTTPIFDGELEFIVFNPSWSVPRSISVNEILPKLKANPNYLQAHEMEAYALGGGNKPVNTDQVDWKALTSSTLRYSFRQKPGKKNPLGRVKFLFPNAYEVYMHDTPNHQLFNRTERGFSHGCIRLSDPLKLQEYLMKDDTLWTPAKVQQIWAKGEEKYIRLKKKIPVFLAYFTTWQDSAGNLHFREDLYGHDAQLAEDLLFPQPEQLIQDINL